MATKARQQYFADETSLQKDSREFSIADDVQQKINSVETGAQVNVIETVKVNGTALAPDANKAVNVEVPEIIDNLYSTSTDDALSAKQGKVLYDYIQNIASRGRFLTNWNCATGLPVTNPTTSPYTYMAGDYYSVSNVASGGGTNYRPDGSSYIIGQASTTAETEVVNVSDFYLYDGTNWLLLVNTARQIAVDSSLSTTSTNPVENRVVTNAINGKQDTLIAGTNIQIAADGKTISATDTTYSAGNNISIDANNQISATDTTYSAGTGISIDANNVISSTVSPGATYTAGSGIDITSNVISADTSVVATQTDLAGKQDVLTAGTNIQIDSNTNTISATDTTYTAGTGINIDANNVISSTVSPGTTYTAGSGIDITSNVISADTTVVATQTDIANFFDKVVDDSDDITEGSTNLFLTSAERTILGNTSGTNTGDQTATDFDIKDLTDSTSLRSTWSGKQDALTAGTNIQINGSTISATDTTYNAGTGIAILNGVDYSALQGPCSTGFHVPTLGEVNKTKTIMNSLGLDTFNGWVNNFFISMAGFRYPRYGASQTMIGDGENRWTSTCQSGGRPYSVKVLGQSALTIQIDYSSNASFGACVRPFYNGYVEPTATWTVLNGTLGGPGIFHNATDGIISLNDGTNYITMADKNLGATTVYSSGDTRSQANCGNTYQWGNNYGFSYSSTVSTSNTKVDASTYGPGNYYSSSTFIQTTTSENDWSNPSNTNLWGGDVGIVTINNAITNIGVTSVNGQTGDVTIQTGGNYSAGTGINIDSSNVISADTTVVATQTDLANKQGTLTASTGINIDSSNNISNTLPGPTIAATAPTGTEGALWYDTTNNVLMAHDGTAWKEAGTQMKILSYGHSTWQDFIDAYNENAIVYCRASSQSNPGSGTQGRMAFMAFIDINSSTQAIQGVEFQYYRSRSDHNSAANQVDEVYVYKLTSNGTWTVTQRNTAAKAVAGTGINLAFGSGNMTIANTGVTSVNNNTGAITIEPGITKKFTLSSTSDTTNAQAAIDRILAGKEAIIEMGAYTYYLQITSTIQPSGDPVYYFISWHDLYVNGEIDVPALIIRCDSQDQVSNIDSSTTTIRSLPTTGSNGQVLTVVSGAPTWANASGGDVVISSDSNNELTTGAGLWAGDENDLPASLTANTVYLCYSQSSGTPRLPAAYQEVEYIESGSDGNSEYIQFSLPYFGGGDYSVEIDVSNVGFAEGDLLTMKQGL